MLQPAEMLAKKLHNGAILRSLSFDIIGRCFKIYRMYTISGRKLLRVSNFTISNEVIELAVKIRK